MLDIIGKSCKGLLFRHMPEPVGPPAAGAGLGKDLEPYARVTPTREWAELGEQRASLIEVGPCGLCSYSLAPPLAPPTPELERDEPTTPGVAGAPTRQSSINAPNKPRCLFPPSHKARAQTPPNTFCWIS
ncbi:unnamed protein product [Nippostrongylus brasiliensis]|uniref:Uncharacterized protein n=1 Tax=Nippostrongylus brasiliensis TaxID=27835 RepID=A0A0N4XVY7_NIPBR|nr:unnamed protein product [Nippostrongylus brasiliensis]